MEGAKKLVPSYQKTTQAPRSHLFMVGHGTKWIRKANIWLKMAKCLFLAKIGRFWAKNPKSFATHITEKPALRAGLITEKPSIKGAWRKIQTAI